MTATPSDATVSSGGPSPLPTRMRAVVQDEYGHAEVLRVEEIDVPTAAADEVLIAVAAAGVDRGVWHVMAGLPYPVRLGFGLRAPRNRVRGLDVAGRVVAVGSDVTTAAVGDDVFGIATGSFAQYTTAKAAKIASAPVTMTARQAAAVPVSGLTALQAIRDKARVEPGQRVLILGASGGVGTFAVQIAKTHGAVVTGVCSAEKADLVRTLGADEVLDYARDGIGTGYDAIIDIGGNRSLRSLRAALQPRGVLVIVGGETGGRWLGGFDRNLRAPLLSLVVSQRLVPLIASENRADLVVLAEMIDAGTLTAAVDRAFPLEQAADGVRHVADGRARGKVVITV